MEKRECCGCGDDVRLVLACSGGSNVGQITNEVAKRLDVDGQARMYCLAGAGGHISGMVASIQGAKKVLVLDGCPVQCGKMVMDQAGIDDYEYLVVTELGVEKAHDFRLDTNDVDRVTAASRAKLNGDREDKSNEQTANSYTSACASGERDRGGCCCGGDQAC
jgi:uncharacterized metal-binding protein